MSIKVNEPNSKSFEVKTGLRETKDNPGHQVK